MSESESTNGGFLAFVRGNFTPTAGFFGISSHTTAPQTPMHQANGFV